MSYYYVAIALWRAAGVTMRASLAAFVATATVVCGQGEGLAELVLKSANHAASSCKLSSDGVDVIHSSCRISMPELTPPPSTPQSTVVASQASLWDVGATSRMLTNVRDITLQTPDGVGAGIRTFETFDGDVSVTYTLPDGCGDYLNAGFTAVADDALFDFTDSNVGMYSHDFVWTYETHHNGNSCGTSNDGRIYTRFAGCGWASNSCGGGDAYLGELEMPSSAVTVTIERRHGVMSIYYGGVFKFSVARQYHEPIRIWFATGKTVTIWDVSWTSGYLPPLPPPKMPVRSNGTLWVGHRQGATFSGDDLSISTQSGVGGAVRSLAAFDGDVSVRFTMPNGCSDYLNAGFTAVADDLKFNGQDSNVDMPHKDFVWTYETHHNGNSCGTNNDGRIYTRFAGCGWASNSCGGGDAYLGELEMPSSATIVTMERRDGVMSIYYGGVFKFSVARKYHEPIRIWFATGTSVTIKDISWVY